MHLRVSLCPGSLTREARTPFHKPLPAVRNGLKIRHLEDGFLLIGYFLAKSHSLLVPTMFFLSG